VVADAAGAGADATAIEIARVIPAVHAPARAMCSVCLRLSVFIMGVLSVHVDAEAFISS
jgi:hypothetical protein